MAEEKREYYGCPSKAFTDSDFEKYDQFIEKYENPEEGNRAYNKKYLMILANSTRKQVLRQLLSGPKTIDDIASNIGIKRDEVKFHLHIADFLLKPANERKEGYFELNKIGEQIVKTLAEK
ncbi:MAG: hypothetical protein SCAL_000486 [Candidatus Syntrophoarchaeum caldarius]|uniref:ArsR family transcriptional regulator n=1 Tax=Candidatus Syntropharchaeum caldarium TaxID=1838285 RepID=A0A1F2PBM0_9EURY|nr:MAG: hypothetical protein SCAL_000486 [Candidatus Syntrophoarchaeum caldarius]